MRIFSRYVHKIFFITTVILFNANCMASVVIATTRVIYPYDEKEVGVKLNNTGSSPILIQSWIDKGDANANPTSIEVPFILTPPISRIEAGKGQTLRLQYTGGTLPTNQESVFWLNVLEVPNKADVNHLQIALRTRIKIFYRPAKLAGYANDAVNAVTWQVEGHGVKAFNPTPYHVSFTSLAMNGKNIKSGMLAPHASMTFNLAGHVGDRISGQFINDFGIVDKFNAVIK